MWITSLSQRSIDSLRGLITGAPRPVVYLGLSVLVVMATGVIVNSVAPLSLPQHEDARGGE